MDYSPHRKFCKRALVMAILLIVIGLCTFHTQLFDPANITWRSSIRVFSGVVLVTFGILMMLPRFRNIMSAVGLMCLGIGISRLIISISYTIATPSFVLVDDLLVVLFMGIFGYIMMLFAIYQIVRGSNFLRGNSMNAFIMRFTSMGIVIGYLVVLFYACQFFEIDVYEVWEVRTDFLTSPILYTMYFYLLCSDEVFNHMQWETARMNILNVVAPMNPGRLTVSSPEYLSFRNSMEESGLWTKVENGSPVTEEIRLNLKANGAEYCLILRKWKGSEAVYYSIVPGNDGAYVTCIHGVMKHIEFEENVLCIHGENHVQMSIYVDPNQKPCINPGTDIGGHEGAAI